MDHLKKNKKTKKHKVEDSVEVERDVKQKVEGRKQNRLRNKDFFFDITFWTDSHIQSIYVDSPPVFF